MAHTVTDKDLQTMVEMLEEGRRECPVIGMPLVVLQLVQNLVPCDVVSFLEIEPAICRGILVQDMPQTATSDGRGGEDADPFWVHFWDCSPCSHSVLSGDQRSITTISDFYSQRQWHQTGMHIDCLSDIEHSAVVNISSPAALARRVILFRCGGADFDQRDRLLLALLRPHIDELYQDLQRRRQPDLGLTPRQRQLLALVAAGYSNTEIARELVISAATVRTHLEKIFKQLDVTNRSAAAAKTFPAVPY